MYSRPPDVTTPTFNTSAAPNTSVTANVIPAPGLGFVLRIVHLHIASVPATTGKIRAQFQSAIGPTVIAHMGMQPGANDDIIIPDPGIQLVENSGLDISHSSDVATQNVRVTVYFYIDPI